MEELGRRQSPLHVGTDTRNTAAQHQQLIDVGVVQRIEHDLPQHRVGGRRGSHADPERQHRQAGERGRARQAAHRVMEFSQHARGPPGYRSLSSTMRPSSRCRVRPAIPE